jgi:hypothetical protein
VKISLGGQHIGVILSSGEPKEEFVNELLLKVSGSEEKKQKKS